MTVFSLDEKGNFVGNDEEHLRLIADRSQKEFTVQEKDGTKTVFDLNSGWLLRMEDCNGNAMQLLRQKNGYLSAVRLPRGTVASRISRGREMIRKDVKKEEAEDA